MLRKSTESARSSGKSTYYWIVKSTLPHWFWGCHAICSSILIIIANGTYTCGRASLYTRCPLQPFIENEKAQLWPLFLTFNSIKSSLVDWTITTKESTPLHECTLSKFNLKLKIIHIFQQYFACIILGVSNCECVLKVRLWLIEFHYKSSFLIHLFSN